MSREIDIDLDQIFEDLDSDVRELLTTIHSIKIAKIINDKEKEREDLVKARWLAARILDVLQELG